MVTRKPTSKQRGRRSSKSQGPSVVVPSERRLTTVCSERRALMRADAVLRCVAIALEYDGWTDDEPDYVEAIGVARNLISESIERLESRSASSTAGPTGSDTNSAT